MIFWKVHGSGNDFVLIEDYDETFPINIQIISHICNRNFGIGADGVLLLQKSEIATLKMRIFNQDGSEAQMCGNGLRCVVRHLGKNCSIETKGGISLGEFSEGLIKVSLPKTEIIRSFMLDHHLESHLVDTGTPHLVIFTDKIDDEDLTTFAINYRKNHTINVNLAQIRDTGIQVRTFEKGVETETLSCGSGGAAVALIHGNNTQIHFKGANLNYSFDDTGRLWMEGPATQVFQGTICLNTQL